MEWTPPLFLDVVVVRWVNINEIRQGKMKEPLKKEEQHIKQSLPRAFAPFRVTDPKKERTRKKINRWWCQARCSHLSGSALRSGGVCVNKTPPRWLGRLGLDCWDLLVGGCAFRKYTLLSNISRRVIQISTILSSEVSSCPVSLCGMRGLRSFFPQILKNSGTDKGFSPSKKKRKK